MLNGNNPKLDNINKALVIVAHPDDIDYGCAGTIAWLTSNGVEVSYCIVTSGDAGGDNDGLSNTQRAKIREEEQTNAAKVVGVTNLHFLKQSDGMIESSLDLREKLTRVIRKVPNVWIMADETTDTFINITEHIDQKLEALFQHKSQINDKNKAEMMIREWTSTMANKAGLEAGQYCEGFRYINTE